MRNLENTIDITCIIVSYNEVEYLKQAIESCLCQKKVEGRFEIIIGDDGSDDGSIDLIKKYASSYPNIIKYFVMNRDVNDKEIIASIRVSNVIKRGMSLANGKYINLLSGDDWFCDKEKFYKQVGILKNSGRKVNICNVKKVFDNGKEEVFSYKKCPNHYLLNFRYIHISTFMFSREVYDRNFILDRFCDDVGMIYSLDALGEEFTYCNDVMFAYRQRGSSIMHTKSELELAIIELLLLQDVLNSRITEKVDVWLRFTSPIRVVFENRNHILDNPRYIKYINISKKYNNDILSLLCHFDKSPLLERVKLGVLYLEKKIKSKYLSHKYKNYRCSSILKGVLNDESI